MAKIIDWLKGLTRKTKTPPAPEPAGTSAGILPSTSDPDVTLEAHAAHEAAHPEGHQ
jgi:hypothetical protein